MRVWIFFIIIMTNINNAQYCIIQKILTYTDILSHISFSKTCKTFYSKYYPSKDTINKYLTKLILTKNWKISYYRKLYKNISYNSPNKYDRYGNLIQCNTCRAYDDRNYMKKCKVCHKKHCDTCINYNLHHTYCRKCASKCENDNCDKIIIKKYPCHYCGKQFCDYCVGHNNQIKKCSCGKIICNACDILTLAFNKCKKCFNKNVCKNYNISDNIEN